MAIRAEFGVLRGFGRVLREVAGVVVGMSTCGPG